MIFLAATLLAGDSWTWDVTLRYDTPADGILLAEKERWTIRVGPKATLVAERQYLGSLIDDTIIPSADARPEIAKGTVEKDGTLTVKPDWSDPAAARAFRRLLNPDKKLDERVAGWPTVRHASIFETDAKLPGSNLPARLNIEVSLTTARLGGKRS